MIRHSLLALALIGVAGVAYAQTMNQNVISSPPQPSPGDYQRQAPGLQPADQQAQMAPSYGAGGCGYQEAMKDEYGFRYDAQGNRLNRQGCVISPQTKTP
jgi:hypothetical protein